MLLEAKELSHRMSLSETSLRLLGYDIVRVMLDDDSASIVDDASVPLSPSKSPSKKSRFRRSSDTQDEKAVEYARSLMVIELESVSLAYISLEGFQEAWERLELYDDSHLDKFSLHD